MTSNKNKEWEEKNRTEPTYRCEHCGKARTKAEGGTIFTLCDVCWELIGPGAKAKTEPAKPIRREKEGK